MFLNAHDLEPGQMVEGDVAIVGSGACGITLAHVLARQGREVVLLEAGGRRYEAASQDAYRGVAEGPCLEAGDEYLASSRLRYLGGTTNHWAGWCRPLDPLDFERRAELEHSGWPIGYEELARYFPETERILELPPEAAADDGFGDWKLFADSDVVERCVFRFSPPVRFRIKYDRELAESRKIRLLLHASVVRVRLAPAGGRVAALEVATAGGRRVEVRARLVVLAAGAIENARLLLASDDVHQRGIGNAHDLVGRFFMDHPHRLLGSVLLHRLPGDPRDFRRRKDAGQEHLSLLKLSAGFRRARGLAGAALQIVQERRANRRDQAVKTLTALDRLRRPAAEPARAPAEATLLVRGEQVPNPDSRVRLDREVDRFGMRRVRLDWRMADRDLRTITATAEALGAELARTATGRFRSRVDPEDPWSGTVGGNHHIGTTRMASAPSAGVVDPDCRLFGVENLYLGGSSVFPTSGYANPTFTIVALTLRLAEHLDRRLA